MADKGLDIYFAPGEMAERSNAAVLKTVDSKGPGVRIPLSPLSPSEALAKEGFYFLSILITTLLSSTILRVIISVPLFELISSNRMLVAFSACS